MNLKTDTQNVAQKKEDVSEVTVAVTALKDLPAGIQYSWKLPEDSQLMGGTAPTGSFPALAEGDTVTVTIKLNGFSKEEIKYLGFEATTTALHQTVKREALYSSRIEDSIEYRVQKTHEHMMNQPQKLGQKVVNKFDPENVVK